LIISPAARRAAFSSEFYFLALFSVLLLALA